MAGVVHRELSEISMDYVNLPEVPVSQSRSSKESEVTPAAAGRKLIALVAVGFGLLCILQAVLNVSLRLALYSPTTTDMERDELRQQADQYFQHGWVYFSGSFYYISSIKKTWQESRDDCLQRGADLVTINTKEEQDFTRHFHKITWIGLTGGGTTGVWKWVDGSPLSQSHWGDGEPNGFENKNEDCVEVKFYEQENSWNDIPCNDHNFWICEKKMAL